MVDCFTESYAVGRDPQRTKHSRACHPVRSRRTSPTWVTFTAFGRSLDFARDDIAVLWVRPHDIAGDLHRIGHRVSKKCYRSSLIKVFASNGAKSSICSPVP